MFATYVKLRFSRGWRVVERVCHGLWTALEQISHWSGTLASDADVVWWKLLMSLSQYADKDVIDMSLTVGRADHE